YSPLFARAVFGFLLIGMSTPASAQRAQSPPAAAAFGTVQGTITTQNGAIALGGAVVSLSDSTAEVARVFSNGDGTFRFDDVRPGQYKLMVSIEGFDPTTTSLVVASGRTTDVPIDLKLAIVAERVDVVASDNTIAGNGTLSSSDTVGNRELEQIAPGGG